MGLKLICDQLKLVKVRLYVVIVGKRGTLPECVIINPRVSAIIVVQVDTWRVIDAGGPRHNVRVGWQYE